MFVVLYSQTSTATWDCSQKLAPFSARVSGATRRIKWTTRTANWTPSARLTRETWSPCSQTPHRQWWCATCGRSSRPKSAAAASCEWCAASASTSTREKSLVCSGRTVPASQRFSRCLWV